MYPVDKNVPITLKYPTGRACGYTPDPYPFRFMEKGDSFFIPRAEMPLTGSTALTNAARYYAKKTGQDMQFIARNRTIDRDGEDGYRLWRVR